MQDRIVSAGTDSLRERSGQVSGNQAGNFA
jgi:hypothetical protein